MDWIIVVVISSFIFFWIGVFAGASWEESDWLEKFKKLRAISPEKPPVGTQRWLFRYLTESGKIATYSHSSPGLHHMEVGEEILAFDENGVGKHDRIVAKLLNPGE